VMGKREPCCCENFVDIRMWSGLLGLEMLEGPSGNYGFVGGPNYDHMRVNDGQWHLIAEIREGTTLSIFVDNRLDIATVTQGVVNIASAIPFIVGWNACIGIGPVPFGGELDELQMYDRALSLDEVERLYFSGSGYPFSDYRLERLGLRFAKDEGPFDGYTVGGRFTVDPECGDVDLMSDQVKVSVGPTTLTIPAGSFTRDKALYSCRIDIDGVPVSAVFEDLGGGSFAFVIDARSVDLSGTTNVVPVALWVGSDWGKTSSHLAGSLSLDGGIAVPGGLAPATPVPMPRGR